MNECKNIVLIDDDTYAHSAFGLMIMSFGCRLSSIFCCELAFEYAKNPKKLDKPDVVIVDFMLGHISGVDVIRRMRANPYFDNIPIFLYTGCGDDSAYEDDVKKLKIAGIIKKPSSKDVVVQCINDALKLRNSING